MRIIMFIGIMVFSSMAWAGNQQQTSADDLLKAATMFLDAFAAEQENKGFQVDYELGSIDSRLHLAACPDGPKVEFSGDPWRTVNPRLAISCDGDRPWRLFLSSDLAIQGPALVAARALSRGDRINAGMITTANVAINTIRRGAIESRDELVGMELARSINKGTTFTPDLISTPDAVSRGDHVVITARSGNFSVQSRGKALASGQIGEQVPIQNLSSLRTVRGLITAPGQVEIPM